MKPILCLDFDGVLHSYTSGWKGADVIPDPPVEGAQTFLAEAVEYFDVQIFSSRNHQDGGIPAMKAWLVNWGVHVKLVELIKFPTVKPPAMVTLDDRAITFTGGFPYPKELLRFKPWNK